MTHAYGWANARGLSGTHVLGGPWVGIFSEKSAIPESGMFQSDY
jgi:hypothetical protein